MLDTPTWSAIPTGLEKYSCSFWTSLGRRYFSSQIGFICQGITFISASLGYTGEFLSNAKEKLPESINTVSASEKTDLNPIPLYPVFSESFFLVLSPMLEMLSTSASEKGFPV